MLKYHADCSDLYAEQICCSASLQPAAQILRQCVAIGNLRGRIDSLHACNYEFESTAEHYLLNIFQEAQEIDSTFEAWEQGLAGWWLRRTATHKLSSVLEVNIDFYSDIQVGKVWNQYRCARIFLHEAIIDALEKPGSIDTINRHEIVSRMKRCAHVITTMLSAICDSIPFHLQQVDCSGNLVAHTSQRVLGGEHLLWPLDVVFHSQWSTENQRSQARKALEEIGTSLGLMQALKSIQINDGTPPSLLKAAGSHLMGSPKA